MRPKIQTAGGEACRSSESSKEAFFVCKILIVDDDDDLRDVLHVFLSDCGHDVHESSDGQEALAWLSRHRDAPPCLAIFDLRMPVVDGWDLLATVRRDPLWRKLPVVVLSGTIQRGEYPPVLAADGFWSKPVDLHRLERVHKHCPAHRSSWRNKSSVLEGPGSSTSWRADRCGR
jgi:CheY-like chemotaxis protein